MRKNNFKNCIAFTMMEMTLVLLITSIIAAASTPIITSAVSDYADKNYNPSSGEAADAPWRKATVGGIFNSPIEKGSPVGIGVKFGDNVSAYKDPALVIESMSSKNIINAPQIKISHGINDETKHSYASLGMDEFENIMFVSGDNSFVPFKSPFANSSDTGYFGRRSIYIGSDLFYDKVVDSATDLYNQDSIFIGQDLNSLKSENTIQMGSKIAIWNNQKNNIYLGHNFVSKDNSSSTYQGNIQIGNYADQADKKNVITIGNYAGVYSSLINEIIVGNYAGVNYRKNFAKSGVSTGQKSVLIGKYAGAYYFNPSGGSTPTGMTLTGGSSNNVLIGGYAGYGHTSKNDQRVLLKTIMIGERAGFQGDTASPSASKVPVSNSNDICIGAFSCDETKVPNRSISNIYIGYYAGLDFGISDTSGFVSKNVLIGSYAGANAGGFDSIFIGSSDTLSNSTGSNDLVSNKYSQIAIGRYAGVNTLGKYGSVSIGYYAGYNGVISGLNDTSAYYGNVAIGPFACYGVRGVNKWCLGGWQYSLHKTLESGYLADTSGNKVWTPGDNTPQMFIGPAQAGSEAATAILLYSNTVYRPSKNTFDQLSDRRLKTNIIPTSNHLSKIRKVNVYDYNMKNDEYKKLRMGVIAQEYKKVFPEDVKLEPNSKKLAVSTGRLIYTMAGAIKELDDTFIDVQLRFNKYVKDFMGLKSKVAKLEKQAQYLKSQNEQMKSQLAKINSKLR